MGNQVNIEMTPGQKWGLVTEWSQFGHGHKVGSQRVSWQKYKKPLSCNSLRASISGGADGTRTRDPRRDRPVFEPTELPLRCLVSFLLNCLPLQ